MTSARIRAVAVVIPANNEEELLPRCIASLGAAIAELRSRLATPPRVLVTLVLDDCTDGSELIARQSGFDVVLTGGGGVGGARAVGVAAALEKLRRSGFDDESVWIASTDADSAVPVGWLTTQLAFADEGVDVVLGTVRPDPADFSPEQQRAWSATHVIGRANGNVHGANLGMRADRYARAGGFDAVLEHEDVRLVERMRALPGIRVLSTDDCWVLTSARQQGRTPGGYAGHLRESLMSVGPAA